MRERTTGLLLGLIIGMAAGVGAYWAATVLMAFRGNNIGPNGLTTLPVQAYPVTISPQGTITITKAYYTVNGIHALVIQASASNLAINQVSSDARTYNMTSMTITQTATWYIIPGGNCGYSNDNGQAQTTQLTTSTGSTYSLNYNCIYPPTATNMTFTGLIAPVHTPCTYVGSQPPSCTSLVD